MSLKTSDINGSYYITLLDFESSKMITDTLNVDFQLQKSPQQNPSYRAFTNIMNRVRRRKYKKCIM
jgi:hypothetical protein